METGQVDRFRLTGSGEGEAIAQLYGSMRIGGHVIWAAQFQEGVTVSGGGKGGPPKPKTPSHSDPVSRAVARRLGGDERVDGAGGGGEGRGGGGGEGEGEKRGRKERGRRKRKRGRRERGEKRRGKEREKSTQPTVFKAATYLGIFDCMFSKKEKAAVIANASQLS